MNLQKIIIIEVSDQYINYMMNFFKNTMLSNKEKTRVHPRKYIGVILKVNNFNYFAPLSSPKPSDYNSNGSIKKSTYSILRITKTSKNKLVLIGTIKLNNMIPVPLSEINYYNTAEESDVKYKSLIFDELKWIKKNTDLIYKKAKYLYTIKINESTIINGNNMKFLKSIMPFKEAEEKCEEYSHIAA